MNRMATKVRIRRAHARSRRALSRAMSSAADASMRNEPTRLAHLVGSSAQRPRQ